jgi:hypothetical protein
MDDTEKAAEKDPESSKITESREEDKDKDKGRDNRIEIISTILLSLAIIATAWCAYQSTRWSGLMTISFSEAAANRNQATIYATRAGQQTLVDASIFLDYAVLFLQSEPPENLKAYEDHLFTDRLETAMNAWKGTDPLNNPDAPRNPFEMSEYKNETMTISEDYNNKAEAKTQEAKDNNQQSDNYVLLTVLFASVLFFGGVSSKFSSRRMQITMLVLGGLIFVATAIALSFQSIY